MRFAGLALVSLSLLIACSSKPQVGFGGDGGGDADDIDGDTDSSVIISDPDSGPTGCEFNDATDHDGDGFSGADGDCNDCDKNINPGTFDVVGNGVDEDCSGTPDDEPTNCDGNLKIDSLDGFDGAKAMDLCRKTTTMATGKLRTWGVTSAKYMLPDGLPGY